jgi:anti-anti-sigma regulatory factor
MILATSNKAQRLLYLKMFGKITAAELHAHESQVRGLAVDLGVGFRLLSDLTELEAMDEDCIAALGQTMDFLKTSGGELVVRIIPDPRKDIGLNILSIFHYGRGLRTVTCPDFAEALHLLKI